MMAPVSLLRGCAGLAMAFEVLTLATAAAADPAPLNAPTTDPTRVPDSSLAPPAPQRLESRWYGWQTLTTDGAAIALLVGTQLASGGAPPGPLETTGYALGTLSYVFGGPIVHFAHRNPGRGFASFALRVPAPIITGLAAMGVYCGLEPGEYCGLIGVPFAGAAILAAIAIDAAVFGYDEVPVDRAETRSFRMLPLVSVTRHGASLGLALTL
jgi:hypothetical protein